MGTTGNFDPEQEALLKAKGFKQILYRPVAIEESSRVVSQVLLAIPST